MRQQLGGEGLRRWWKRLGRSDQIALLGVLVGLFGVLPAYFVLFLDHKPEPASRPSATSALTVTTQGSRTASSNTVAINVEETPVAEGEWSDYSRWVLIPKPGPVIALPPSDCGQFYQATARMGGIPAQSTFITITVQGLADRAVLLSGMKAKVVERRVPVRGTVLSCQPQGDVSPRRIYIDLGGRCSLTAWTRSAC
jgi:hypothetical protein